MKVYTNKELIQICKRAKLLLWNGEGRCQWQVEEQFVCHALDSATKALHGSASRLRPAELTRLVKDHIGNAYTMMDFLGRKFNKRTVDAMTDPQVQAWRFLMLDNMIAILEAKTKPKKGTK